MQLFYIYFHLEITNTWIKKYHPILNNINNILKEEKINLSNIDSIVLFLHIKRLISRYENNNLIKNYTINSKIKQKKISISNKIINILNINYNKKASKTETILLAMHINY